MLEAGVFCEALKQRGFHFYSTVPCSYFQGALKVLQADPQVRLVTSANEGAALAAASGAALAGVRPVVLLQNSGLGNLVNPLTSLAATYRLPALLVVSWRACPAEPPDEPQHRLMGQATPGLLDLLRVPHAELSADPGRLEATLDLVDGHLSREGTPAALLLRKAVLSGHTGAAAPQPVPPARPPLDRGSAITAVLSHLEPDDAVVATTGFTSRDLMRVRDRSANFYMQGSMGHALALGLGLALSRADRRVVVLDGDGAMLMHLGTVSTVGFHAPANLLHVVLDNGAYASTGGQRTTSTTTDLAAVARACGYRQAFHCVDEAGLLAATGRALGAPGPALLHVGIGERTGLPAPRVTDRFSPAQVTARVQRALGMPADPWLEEVTT
jgi:phosphonopyruvate decarboxylase